MDVYCAGRSPSAEDQVWDQLDRMRNAGPVADSYLAAHERRAWAIATGRSVTSGTRMTGVTATACRHWLGTRLITAGRWLAGTSPVPPISAARPSRAAHENSSLAPSFRAGI